MSLYLLFPFLLKAIERYPKSTLFGSLLITIIFRLVVPSGHISFLGFPEGAGLLDRIIFPCFIFEFTLGMYIAKMKLYPKKIYSSTMLFFVADISYFVFLTHQFVRAYLGEHNPNTFWTPSSYIPYMCTVVVVSAVIMYSDIYIQRIITKFESLTKKKVSLSNS